VVIGGISRGKSCVCGWSMEGLPVRGSGSRTVLADVARLGASEMIPQPWEADDNAAIRIKALTRHSKTAVRTEETDLGSERCTSHREEYLQQ
jgi:hypothetical protein